MAGSSPSDKLLMVRALKELGEVVAVTGDGTNDAPALHEADIGSAMGIQGTEFAKESSDIIIMDDNFASVVKVVRWGRSVYNNIQKFIQFQLTVNVAALTINFVAAVSSGDVPLTAVQLLWVNLIMDTLGALALATERPTDKLLQRLPVGRKERNVFRGLLTNWLFLGILGFCVLFQSVIVEFLNKFASTVKPELKYWVISIAIGSLSWPHSFFIKFIPVPTKPLLSSTVRPFRRYGRRRRRRAINEDFTP